MGQGFGQCEIGAEGDMCPPPSPRWTIPTSSPQLPAPVPAATTHLVLAPSVPLLLLPCPSPPLPELARPDEELARKPCAPTLSSRTLPAASSRIQPAASPLSRRHPQRVLGNQLLFHGYGSWASSTLPVLLPAKCIGNFLLLRRRF